MRVVRHLEWRAYMLRQWLRGWPAGVADRMTAVGQRLDVEWLTYNPILMRHYHQWALADAGHVAHAITSTFPEARTGVDVGSGTGAFAAELQQRGVGVQALERSWFGRRYSRRQGVPTLELDLTSDPPARVAGPFDVAYCFEVAEHLPPELGDRLVAFLCTLAPTVIYSAAPPEQPGSGHVNGQPRSYWERRFAEHGYARDPVATDRLAADLQAVTVSWWLRSNVDVYSRRSD